jgi:hypothetical protein
MNNGGDINVESALVGLAHLDPVGARAAGKHEEEQ